MKLRIMSDLHIEFHADLGRSFVRSLKETEDQIAVIAGDLSSASSLPIGLKLLCEKFSRVIYVTGNHEHYGSSIVNVHDKMVEYMSKLPNLTWLSNSNVEIEGKTIHGSTLWFPEPTHLGYHKMYLNDYHKIMQFEPMVYQWHDHSVHYLKNHVKEGDIVVTHHAPTYKSIHEKYQGHLMNCFFASHNESIVRDQKPLLWVHGHTHSNFDYYIGDTRMLCNPFGYAAYEENPDFDENLVVVVPT